MSRGQMIHSYLILALIQDFSVGHIIVTQPLQTGYKLKEWALWASTGAVSGN